MPEQQAKLKFSPLFHFPHTHTLLEETGRELARRAGVDDTENGEPSKWAVKGDGILGHWGVVVQRKCPRQLFRRSVTEAGQLQAGG